MINLTIQEAMLLENILEREQVRVMDNESRLSVPDQLRIRELLKKVRSPKIKPRRRVA